MRTLVFILTFAGGLSAGEFVGPTLDGAKVCEIHVMGNLRTPEADVLKLLETRVGAPFSEKIWRRDYLRVTKPGVFQNAEFVQTVKESGVMLMIDLLEDPVIEKIQIIGVRPDVERAMIECLSSRVGEGCRWLELNRDREHIRDTLLARGYRDVQVENFRNPIKKRTQFYNHVELEVDAAVALRFDVKLGRLWKIHAVKVEGNSSVESVELLKNLTLKAGDPFRMEQLDDDERRLGTAYLRRGFLDGSVFVRIDKVMESPAEGAPAEEVLADVVFEITEGPQFHIGAISITGNRIVPFRELESVIKLKVGDAWSDWEIEKDQAALVKCFRERGFSRVKVYSRAGQLDKSKDQRTITFVIDESEQTRADEVVEY